MKTVSILLVLILGAFVYYNLQKTPKKEPLEHNNSKPLIALSSYALYDIAKNIAGESMNIFCMLPYGVDVHSFEPTPKMIANVAEAKLVVYSGAGLQPWTHSFEDQKNGLDMSRYVKLLDATEEHETDGHHHHHESDFDPHYWLDIENMILATNILKDKFIRILPQNQDMYEENAREYIIKLQEIDRLYKAKLSTCKVDSIVVEHNAFSYLAAKYDFDVHSISGLSPDAQPSAQVMQNILTIVKEKKINTLFFESLSNDKMIKTIANDAHVGVEMLQPLENITQEEAANGATYESLMLENLEKIAKSRECQ